MDRQELMDVLSAMSEDDKLSIQAYLESKGAWTTEIANEIQKNLENTTLMSATILTQRSLWI